MIRRLTHSSLFILMVLLAYSCQAQGNRSVQGEGGIVKQEITLAALQGLDMKISGQVILTQGSPQKITIEAQQNIIDLLGRDVKEGVWLIGFDRDVNNIKPVKIHITLPSLAKVGLSGSGSISATNKFTNVNDLDVYLSGSGNITLDVKAKSADVALNGSGEIQLEGSSHELDIAISGSGIVDAGNLKSADCKVEISGSGDAHIHADKSLETSIAGSGGVKYSGSPSVSTSVVGSGEVKKVN